MFDIVVKYIDIMIMDRIKFWLRKQDLISVSDFSFAALSLQP
jgi:hypothetical protein